MKMSNTKITIQDIADAVGVSKTTISRYLNGKYNYMSQETRKKIETAIATTNFRPNQFAKSLKTSRSDLIGLIIPEAASTMTPYLISSICDKCASYERKVIIVSTHNDEETEKRFIQSLLDQQVDGIITATGSNFELYQKINSSNCPVILIDRVSPACHLDFVAVNHRQGISDVLRYAIQKGFRKIYFLLRKSKNQQGTFSIREQCAREICQKYTAENVVFEKMLIDDSQMNRTDTFDTLLLNHYPKEDGIATLFFIADEHLAIPVISNVFRLGLAFSNQFHIACYDTQRFASFISDSIVTIEQPLVQMGSMATDILIQKIENKTSEHEPTQIYINCTITKN